MTKLITATLICASLSAATACPRWLCFWQSEPENSCPVVKPVSNFDVEKYTAHSWYVQKQQVNGYQGPEDLFCVTATYTLDDTDLIKVDNRANRNQVNGSLVGGSKWWQPGLCAKQKKEGKGKLSVLPCPLFRLGLGRLAGPYWVIAVDGNYTWAIISGGQPTEPQEDGSCTTKLSGINNSGLWLFTAEPNPEPTVVADMEKILVDMGVSTKFLLDVKQQGCSYADMPLK